MNDKVCVITGAAGSIGQQIALALAREGAIVVCAARDAARADEAVRAVGGKAEPLVCDVASIASMRAATAALTARHPKIHLLVNNAAVFSNERLTSKDGLELGYAVNTLAPFVMANLLLPALKAAAPSRIVNLAMVPTAPLDFDDLQLERGYSGFKALKTTKAGHHYLTVELARRLDGSGVTVVTVDPGLTNSKLPATAPLPIRILFKLMGKKPEVTARTPIAACLDARFRSGSFISHKGAEVAMPAFVDAASSRRVWAANAALLGLREHVQTRL